MRACPRLDDRALGYYALPRERTALSLPGMNTFLMLVPDFALILLGWGLRRRAGLGDAFWTGLEKLVYFVLFPALLFSAVMRTHIVLGEVLPLLLSGVAIMALGLVAGLVAQPIMGLDALSFSSRLQCAFRFNSYIAIAVVGKVHGAAGISLMGALMGATVPVANITAVSLMARHGEGNVLREVARNPLVIATLSGVVCNLLGFTVPVPISQFLARLADASIALGLLAVGAALRGGNPGGHWFGAGWLLAVKLMLLPLFAWWAAPWLGLQGMARDVAVIFAALPTASSAYILTTRMGGDGQGVAWLISASTLLAVFSMTLWLRVLGV